MSAFWVKASECDHKDIYPNYLEYISCPTPYCSGTERHCKDCGAYISECGCGWNNSMSGWSMLRWKHFEKKKKMQRTK